MGGVNIEKAHAGATIGVDKFPKVHFVKYHTVRPVEPDQMQNARNNQNYGRQNHISVSYHKRMNLGALSQLDCWNHGKLELIEIPRR